MRWTPLFLLLFISANLHAQLLDSIALDSAKTYFSIERALKNPDQVYKLKLSKKKLTAFPKEILQLKNLNSLDLSKNKIKEIPEEIGSLMYLQEVDFSKNKLDSFPEGLCKSVHLKTLVLNQNRMVNIPKEIGSLTELEVLDMWSNDLYLFPEELRLLKKLKDLDLRVIQINDKEQEWISKLLPNTEIHFSNSCNCF